MGCGGSKPTSAEKPHNSRYLANPAQGPDTFGGYDLPSTGPLTAKQYKERLTTSEGTLSVTLPVSGYTIRYAYVSQRGFYPDSPDKANQDSFAVHTCFHGDPEQHFFGVFDGHGEWGTQCSHFARDKVPFNLVASPDFFSNPARAFHHSMVTTNLQCHRADFDDSMSGTTAISCLIRGRTLLVANVGDSRAVLAERVGDGVVARDLSCDQTPFRADERERVKAMGARVLTLDQMEGVKDPSIDCWTTEEEDDGDPPRLWFPNGMYPGTAFTRSIGDAAAERIGVFAEPELQYRQLGPNDAFLVIASDGVFEFLPSQSVVNMVSSFDDPYEAALSVVAQSYGRWLDHETRTDDITMIILQFVGLDQQAPPVAPERYPKYQQQQQQQNVMHALPPGSGWGGWPSNGNLKAAGAPGSPSASAPRSFNSLAAAGGGGGGGSTLSGAPSLAGSQTGWIQQQQPIWGALVDDIEPLVSSGPSMVSQPQGAGFLTRADSSVLPPMQQPAPSPPQQRQRMTPDQLVMLSDSVRSNFLFSHLTPDERQAVFAAMERITVSPGDIIIRQGDRGDHFYVVESGTFCVLVATAATHAHSLQMAGSAAGVNLDLLADAASHAAAAKLEAIWAAQEAEAAAATKDGLPPGLVSFPSITSDVKLADLGELVHTYVTPAGPLGSGPHPCFGELALLYGKPRAATVVAQAPGSLWRLSRSAYRAALRATRSDPALLVLKALRGVELFAPLSWAQLQQLSERLSLLTYHDGDVVMQQGDLGSEFYIIVQGELVARVWRETTPTPSGPGGSGGDGGGSGPGPGPSGASSRELLVLGPGQYLGERALMAPISRPATVVARGEVHLLYISQATFEGLFGPLGDLLAEHATWKTWAAGQRDALSRSAVLGQRHADVLAGTFDPQSLASKGSLVALADYVAVCYMEGAAGDLHLAARLYDTAAVEARGLGGAVARARQITRFLPPCLLVPHVAALWRGPLGPGEVLATVASTSLATLLEEGPLDDVSAAYVAANAVLALQHLHYLGIIYRGLNALTLLVTEAGLVQLVDFRFAKRNEGRTFTLCGVPEYLAPEIVEGTGHTEAVDWWALGVLIVHLLTGATPFASLNDDELRIYKRITRAQPALPPGTDISPESQDLVRQLLTRDPTKRLGQAPGGCRRLMQHPWFWQVDWEALRAGRANMPLGLRERLFRRGGGELGAWGMAAVQQQAAIAADGRGAGVGVGGSAAEPAWLAEF